MSARSIVVHKGKLAGHYGLTAEELDCILNYDIKYHLGRDTGEEE